MPRGGEERPGSTVVKTEKREKKGEIKEKKEKKEKKERKEKTAKGTPLLDQGTAAHDGAAPAPAEVREWQPTRSQLLSSGARETGVKVGDHQPGQGLR